MSKSDHAPQIAAFRGALVSLRAHAEARYPRVTPPPPLPPREDEDDEGEGSSSGAAFGFDGDALTATGSHPRVSETRRS